MDQNDPKRFDPFFKNPFDKKLEEASATFPQIISGKEIQTNILPQPVEIISGIIARGEKGELAGGSKSFKTWTLIAQALSIASGIDWWGFPTIQSNVLFLNLEIPQAYFDARVRVVAEALGIDIPDSFHVWHLRYEKLWQKERWDQFLYTLKERCAAIANPFLTSDPIYKLLGGRNENAAGEIQLLLQQLDDMIQLVDGANFFGHHFTKGNQSFKDAIDCGAGSGVFARDPDTIMTMRPHEKEDCFTVELPGLRNHPPVNPFVVQWGYPLFERLISADPQALKQPSQAAQKKYRVQLLLQWIGRDQLSATEFKNRLMDQTGMSKGTFYNLLEEAQKQNLIIWDGLSKTYERNGTL